MEKKLSLIMGYECNNNCRFCYCGDKKDFGFTNTQDAKREIEEGFDRGCRIIDFLGGEPTIRNDLLDLVSFAKNVGYSTISITTNGRMFSYKDYSKKIIESGLNSVIFSIHGHNPELHDFLTRSTGSYNQLSKGMKNVKSMNPNIYVCTNTTINRYNYMHLPKIAENNIKLGADASEFIFVHPRGNALKNFDEIVPTLTELKPFIPKTVEIGRKYNISHFVFRYLPICYMIGYEDNLSELVAMDKMREQHVGPEFKDLNVEEGRKNVGRVKGDVCKNCKYFDKCEGIWVEYAERRGLEELKPVRG